MSFLSHLPNHAFTRHWVLWNIVCMLWLVIEYCGTLYQSNYGKLPPIFANPKHILNGLNCKDDGFANDRDDGVIDISGIKPIDENLPLTNDGGACIEQGCPNQNDKPILRRVSHQCPSWCIYHLHQDEHKKILIHLQVALVTMWLKTDFSCQSYNDRKYSITNPTMIENIWSWIL